MTQVLGDVDKIVSTVTTKIGAADTTTHNLQNGDIVTMNVFPIYLLVLEQQLLYQ